MPPPKPNTVSPSRIDAATVTTVDLGGVMRILSFVLARAAALSLSACYVASTQLITGANAVFPVGDGTFKSFSANDTNGGWEESGSGTLRHVGDHYLLHPDPEPGHAPDPKDD